MVNVPGEGFQICRSIVQDDRARAFHQIKPLIIVEIFRGEIAEDRVVVLYIHAHRVGVTVRAVEHLAPVVRRPAYGHTVGNGFQAGLRQEEDFLAVLQRL